MIGDAAASVSSTGGMTGAAAGSIAFLFAISIYSNSPPTGIIEKFSTIGEFLGLD
jgi:hypothetical protein